MDVEEGFSDAVFLVGPTPRSLIVDSEVVEEDVGEGFDLEAGLDVDRVLPTSD